MVRLRLYETLSLLPANSLESSYTHLLRMLVAEFTLTENPANTTNSLLRDLCHSDDSIILGTWLQETDHKTIEDQVSVTPKSVLPFHPSFRPKLAVSKSINFIKNRKHLNFIANHATARKNCRKNQMEPNRKSHTEHVSGANDASRDVCPMCACACAFCV